MSWKWPQVICLSQHKAVEAFRIRRYTVPTILRLSCDQLQFQCIVVNFHHARAAKRSDGTLRYFLRKRRREREDKDRISYEKELQLKVVKPQEKKRSSEIHSNAMLMDNEWVMVAYLWWSSRGSINFSRRLRLRHSREYYCERVNEGFWRLRAFRDDSWSDQWCLWRIFYFLRFFTWFLIKIDSTIT